MPRSFVLMWAAIYIGLFIIRPWELLVPQLTTVKFERLYGISMIFLTAVTVGFRLHVKLQNVAVAVFCGALGISTALAWDVPAAWEAYYLFLTVVACYVVLLSVIRSPYDLVFIVGVYIGFMELYLGKALWEYFIHDRHVTTMGVTRLIGIEYSFGQPNAFAASIVISLPLWLFLWRCREQIFVHWPAGLRRWLSLGLVLYPCFSVLSVLLTNSRNGMTNLFLFVFLSIFLKGSKGRFLRKVVVVMLVASIGWLLLPTEQKNRWRSIWDPSAGNESAEESKQERFGAYRASMEVFRQFPLTGVGPNNFIGYRVQHIDGVYLVSHDLLAQILSETGLLGAGAFAFFIAAILSNCRRTIAATGRSPVPTLRVLGELARACRFSLLFLLVEGVSNNNLNRFNWLWLAAFSLLAAEFAREIGFKATSVSNIAQKPVVNEGVKAAFPRYESVGR